MLPPFHNEPYVNFGDEVHRKRMLDALALVESHFGKTYHVVIDGERVETPQKNVSRNPAHPSQVIGSVSDANINLVDEAVRSSTRVFASWSRLAPAERARYLVKAAAILRRRIYEFSAWMVYEASKSWNEAYADAAEAVDFLEFYAREAIRWGGSHPTTPFPGEENEVLYGPLGVGAVIAPWNFPLAILCGTTVAPIAAGNTVLVKPAEQTPVVAAKFYELLEMAGIPPGVVNFVPGPGEVVGEAMTAHLGIRFVSFTGSKEVGLHINERAAMHEPGQKFIRRAILEMGGKNAILVDEDVNLDVTAEQVVASAFGFQGQKCSACSRLIAHTKIHDNLLAKVVERARKLTVGDPADFANYMGAVIDLDAYQKVQSYVAIGRQEGRLMCGGDAPPDPGLNAGFFLPPTVISDIVATDRIAQEEIFGPVLAVIRADSFEHGLDIANSTEYGLTGGVFTYDRANLERARAEFQVGNLYFNRKCTGALVDVQPFGGFNLSGTNSKAGGRDYLGLFLQARSIAERY